MANQAGSKKLLINKKTIKKTLNFPKFGLNLLAKIFKAVDFPMPLQPTSPNIEPVRGVGKR